MKKLTDRFLEYLRVEKLRSPLTVKAYESDLRQFAAWLSPTAPDSFDPLSVTTADIRAWIGELAEHGLSATSLRRKAQSLRSLYHWMIREGIATADPSRAVVLAKKKKPLPNFVKETELEEILASTGDSYAAKRSHIVLTLLYSLGLRQAELLGITDADINFSSKELKVTGKRSKQRVVPLPDKLIAEIREWQNVRDENFTDLPTPRPLIAGEKGRLSEKTLYNIVHSSLAGVSTGRRSPHTLRHSFATAMVSDGADLDSVREMLGHASLATTQIYTHISIPQMLANYKGAHPRTKKS